MSIPCIELLVSHITHLVDIHDNKMARNLGAQSSFTCRGQNAARGRSARGNSFAAISSRDTTYACVKNKRPTALSAVPRIAMLKLDYEEGLRELAVRAVVVRDRWVVSQDAKKEM